MALENNLNGHKNSNYEQLGARLQEIALSMTPEQIDTKWGKGFSAYLQNVDNFMVYLRKERRKVEERKEKVPQEFYEQTSRLEFPQLKNWYNSNQGLKSKDKRVKEIVYRERMLELIAQKFDVEIQAAPRGRAKDGRIRTSSDLKSICDTDLKARYMIHLCQGDDVDVADIIAVVYDGKIARDDAIKLLQEPSLRDYLGEFRKPIGIPDIEEYANELLPLDKNGIIASIVYRRLLEYRRNKLGAKPNLEQRKTFLEEMKQTLEERI